jgi:hypothetical protein
MLVVGALLVAGLAAGFYAVRTQSEPAPPEAPTVALPPDLKYVPPDSLGFMTLRGAELYAHPSFRELVDHAATQGADLTFEKIDSELERATSIRPRNIERVTFVLVNRRSPSLIILYTTEPYSHERLGKVLEEGNEHTPQDLNGKPFYVPNQNWRMAYYPAGDRVLLMGDPNLVHAAATSKPSVGPLTPLLERAAGGHTLFLGSHRFGRFGGGQHYGSREKGQFDQTCEHRESPPRNYVTSECTLRFDLHLIAESITGY